VTAVLVACAHGTRSAEGRGVISALIQRVRETAPEGVEVREAYVDVHGPAVGDVVREARAETDDIVIVPLLLSTGYHTEVDLQEAADGLPVAPALGPHPLLAEVLIERMREAGASAGTTAVLAAAGSSRPGAADDVAAMAALIGPGWGGEVLPAFAAAMEPRIDAVVADQRARGVEPAVMSYVLAPGHFAGVIRAAGADTVANPLGADPRIARIVWERWAAAREHSESAGSATARTPTRG
jgi:sirohydrochlorin ferrochelatase